MSFQKVFTREEFHRIIWATPITHLAKTYGVPVTVLTKACEQFNIPRPGPEYWPLKRLGYDMERTELAPVSPGQSENMEITWSPKVKPTRVIEKSLAEQPEVHEGEKPKPEPTKVADDFRRAHPLIRESREVLEKGTADQYGLIRPNWRDRCVSIGVTKGQLRRSLLLLDAVFRALDPTGRNARLIETHGRKETAIKVGDEDVRVRISETTKRCENEGTAEQKKDFLWRRYRFESTGLIIFHIDEYCGPRRAFNDSVKCRLEDRIDEIVATIRETGEALRLRRIERQEEEKKQLIEQQRVFALQRLREEEKARCLQLENQSELFAKAERLRTFIEACRFRLANKGLTADSPAMRWLNWAINHADSIDPLNGGYLENAVKTLPAEPIRAIANPSTS